jgi:hypothetical protein
MMKRATEFLLTCLLVFASFALWHCGILDAPLEEKRKLVEDITVMPDTKVRKSILESFGSFQCGGCPFAEAEFTPYIHPNDSRYIPTLFAVNYHVAFGSKTDDPWITTESQAINDRYGFLTLPQIKLNGSNGIYGDFVENDFPPAYYVDIMDSLAVHPDTTTFLGLKVDSETVQFDTLFDKTDNIVLTFHFRVGNHSKTNTFSAIAFRVLVVKNKPIIYVSDLYDEIRWETVVVAVTETDASGQGFSVSSLPPLKGKIFTVRIPLSYETSKHMDDPLWGKDIGEIEPVENYALVVMAIDGATGLVLNTAGYNYHPE